MTTQPIRVLHVTSGLVGGGIETFVKLVTEELAGDFDSALFTLGHCAFYPGCDIPTVEEPFPARSPLQVFGALRHQIQQWSPDVIHMHYGDAAVLGCLAAAIGGSRARLIIHWHSSAIAASRTPWGHWLQHWSLRHADAVIACSQDVASKQMSHYQEILPKVRVLYNPVKTALFDPQGRALRAGQAVVATDPPIVLFLGRLDIQVKGIDILAAAVRQLPDDAKCRVVVVGPGDHDSISSRLSLPEQVSLVQPCSREEVPALLRSCDIYVQPSRSEGLGISILEAMAAGLPVVASRVGGIPESVEDGASGLLVPPGDPSALAQALEWMIRHPEEREAMGRRGREIVIERFDMPIIIEQLRGLYRGLLAT